MKSLIAAGAVSREIDLGALFKRARAVEATTVTCGISTVGYRFVGKAGQLGERILGRPAGVLTRVDGDQERADDDRRLGDAVEQHHGDPSRDEHHYATAQFGGATFVLAFTSPDAMDRSLRGQAVHQQREVELPASGDLAAVLAGIVAYEELPSPGGERAVRCGPLGWRQLM